MKRVVSKISVTVFIVLAMFIVTAFVLPCLPAQAASTPECWAVIVGISSYQYINNTSFGEDNAREIAYHLSPVWGDNNINLLINSQATKANILDAISWLADNADTDDTVLFDFSGHGGEGGFLCAYDSSPSSYVNDISSYELDRSLQSVQAGKIVIILDNCYAGNFQDDLSKNGRVILMGTRPGELGWEYNSLGHFVFTYFILEAFAEFDDMFSNMFGDFSSTDTNHDYELSAEEIAMYAIPQTTQFENEQHPQLDDRYSGDLALLARFIFTLNTDLPYGTNILTLDGIKYTSDPVSFLWVPDVAHTMSVPQTVSKGSGTRYSFTKWSDGSTSNTRTVSKGSYTANYNKEQLLRVISSFGDPQGDGWYKDGSKANFSVTSDIELPDTKHIFTGWSGDYSGISSSASLLMNAPKTVTANWRHEYLLTLNSEYSQPTGAGWYREGERASISIEPAQGFLIRHIFNGWSGDLTDTSESTNVYMDSPKVITSTWRTDYIQLYILIGGVVVVLVVAIIVTVVLVRKSKRVF